ncbi:MAG: hypothetical protein HQK55_07945 [Deltaproteobacteria bacterium]|nr:hypothetical protein [Deltaproteobacteria bacterium]
MSDKGLVLIALLIDAWVNGKAHITDEAKAAFAEDGVNIEATINQIMEKMKKSSQEARLRGGEVNYDE